MKKFEYQTKVIDTKLSFMGGKVDPESFDQVLNDLGNDGWELLEVVASNQGFGDTRSLVCIFKRENTGE